MWTVRRSNLITLLQFHPEHTPSPLFKSNPANFLLFVLSSICLGKMLVILRDGRKLHGVLRSYDQFGIVQSLQPKFDADSRPFFFFSLSLSANLVLEDTVERIYHENAFAENFHGLFLIRGENVVLLGEIVRPILLRKNIYRLSLATGSG